MAVLKSRIAAKRLPIIWMNGVEGSGMHSHGCNIAERFGYTYIPVENLIRQEMLNTTDRGRMIKTRIANSRRIPDVRNRKLLITNTSYLSTLFQLIKQNNYMPISTIELN